MEGQQGTLAGYETREYLLEKWGRCCAYCGKKDIQLQIEHIHPRAKGGSNSITNLTLSYEKCNTKKGTKDIKDFLKKSPEKFKKIQGIAKTPLADTAAVNSTRFKLLSVLKATGLPEVFKFLLTQNWASWLYLSRDGEEQVRKVAVQRGRDWDGMTEDEREEFIEKVLHEKD